MKRIHESLTRVLANHRLVVWYDSDHEWEDTFATFEAGHVVKLRVDGEEFGTKVRISREPDTRFLVYFPIAKPADADNWLLDLVLQAHEYRADRASIALIELGLPQEFYDLATAHAPFFNSAKRIDALRELLKPDDQARDVRLKMMSVLANTPVDIDALLLRFMASPDALELEDPATATLGAANLTEPFWREVDRRFGYGNTVPSIQDFAVTLFRGANPLDSAVSLSAHGHVFLQRWKDSATHSDSYRAWAQRMERELQVESALTSLGERGTVGSSDTFELFERYALHRLAQAFERGTTAADLRAAIQQRRASYWRTAHASGYEALEHAVSLRELLENMDLTVDSIDAGIRRYTASWWRIDTAYRRFFEHYRAYGQVQVLESTREWVEAHYVNDFLLPLADRWSDRVRALDRWSADAVPLQRQFFDTWVEPFRSKGQKIFVIVSDALRYEAAAEFAEQLRAENRWSADVEVALGALPSYTQLGMASLLPGREYGVDATGSASVDGQSASGTANRASILSLACGGRATAIKSDAFLEMNSKTDARDLMRDHDVIYVYHNAIDHVGDKRDTEAQTTEAVAKAFMELNAIIRKVANVNGTNMLLTADHGFLFQQDPVNEGDTAYLPPAAEWTVKSRRYALGQIVTPAAGVKIFTAGALGVQGEWMAAFPLSLGRFPQSGSGKRYVHGGVSLQEVVIPVVRIHKARTDDTGQVEVDILKVPAKVTTGQLAVALFQDRPAVEKVRPRTIRIGIFAKDGLSLSDQRTLTFDSAEPEARLRETSVVLVLSKAADAYNNRDVELRLEQMAQGTTQWVTYRSHTVKLQKPFTSDFDAF